MPNGFTIGDIIRKAREAKKWNQETLGMHAARFRFRTTDTKINKSTVSKVEKAPYTSEYGTILRLLAALNVSMADVEHRLESPFLMDERHETRKGKPLEELPDGARPNISAKNVSRVMSSLSKVRHVAEKTDGVPRGQAPKARHPKPANPSRR